ncbi:hypothetical protein [Crossiella sp. NPDC003009]
MRRVLLAALLLLTSACMPAADDSEIGKYNLREDYRTGPREGVAALGRTFGSLDELLDFFHAAAKHCDKAKAKRGGAELIKFHLAKDMPPLLGEVAVCDQGFGDILGMVKPGRERDLQLSYQRDLRRDSALWYRATHRLMLGNGFFLFNVTGVGSIGPELYGFRYLRCDAEASVSSVRTEFPADVPGCFLLSRMYGDGT